MAGDKEQVLFERIYAERHERGSWPRMTDLQRQLASEHIDVNVRVTVQASEGRAMLDSSNETVSLNLGGLARVPAARELLEAYVASLQKMLERYRDVGSAPRFTSEDLDVPRLDAKTKDELSELMVREHWGLGSNEGGGEDWSYEITDQVLSADGVETIEDLLAARFGGPTAEAKQEPGREEAWVATLPDHAGPGEGVSGDRPIESPHEDLLSREGFVRVLASQALAQGKEEGFVMGLGGPWGIGKTSLLNLMAGELESDEAYVVRFDPWLFSDSEELVLRFLRELTTQLSGEQRLAKLAERLGEYAQILVPLGAMTPLGWAAPVAGGVLSRWRSAGREEPSAQKQRERIRAALLDLDERLVVMIDDLDRLTPTEIRGVVRLVKLVGDFPNTTYVLAYDEQRVAVALVEADPGEGRRFLEKIVQVSHEVPPVPAAALREALAEGIGGAVGDLAELRFDPDQYANLFADGVGVLFATVRDVRRYTNALGPTVAMLGAEVELADVIALEALRIRVPGSFAALRLARRALGGSAAGDEAIAAAQVRSIIDGAGGYGPEVEAIVRRLFPAAAHHLGGPGHDPVELTSWRRRGRVAHPEVFEIYLNRTLPAGVLPVSLVEFALEVFSDGRALSSFLGGLDDEQLESLLDRLRELDKDLPREDPAAAIAAFYNERRRLHRELRGVFDVSPDYKPGAVALRILRGLTAAEARQASEEALTAIAARADRADLLHTVLGADGAEGMLLGRDATSALTDSFMTDLLSSGSTDLSRERDLAHLFWWAGRERPEETRARLLELVEDDHFLLALLESALGERVGQGQGAAAVRRSYELNWPELTNLVPVARLAARADDLAERLDSEELRPREAEALRQAQHFARAEAENGDPPKPDGS
jgi:hypothetical protein